LANLLAASSSVPYRFPIFITIQPQPLISTGILLPFGSGTTASLYCHSPISHSVGEDTIPPVANGVIPQDITQPSAYHLVVLALMDTVESLFAASTAF